MSKAYFTVKDQTENLIVIERSKFICNIKGVENEEVRQFVKQYNVERHQGYYYAKPLKADALAELLRQNPVFEPLYEV